MNRAIKRALFFVVFLGILVVSAFFFFPFGSTKPATSFRTASVARGDLQVVISSTGTVEPEELVDVGAQVAGRIVSFGKDDSGKTVDYGSSVTEGMVLAQIDDALFTADVALNEAQLALAKAGLVRAEADLGQLQAKLVQAERDWSRARKLGPSDALSQSSYDASQSGYDVAKSNVDVGKAAIIQARSSVAQAEASLRRSRQNLDYCTIKSPVKGVIIDRRVNIGQTVVASLNAPSLFLIAKDLRRLQVWVAVNEADIGNIRPGQPVTFTADAFPGEIFEGTVGKIRLNATMTQNVVTYTVEVVTDNSSGRLLPYLTANVKFITADRHNVLMVPNAALRWSPRQELIAPEARRSAEKTVAPGGEKSSSEGKPSQAGDEEGGRKTLWTAQGEHVRPVSVRVGVSDGGRTEIEGEGIKEGMEIVIGEQAKAEGETPAAKSPFAPQPFRRR